jgi:phosphoribosylformylglycinamidine synthase
MTVAVIRFSASNCDQDTRYVFEQVLQTSSEFVWQDDTELPSQVKAVVLPGGFSFGDYLRAGAIAAHRPIMNAVKRFANAGGPVLGICNGFQILCEAKILPGILMPNNHNRFVCKNVALRVSGGGQGALKTYKKDELITLPIAHHDGRFLASPDELQRLRSTGSIALQYSDVDEQGNALVNGSLRSIAGIFGGPNRNVLGLMPHPERRSEAILGGVDGIRMLQSLIA